LVTADEFLFLFAVVIVFAFGPGALSLDALITKYIKAKEPNDATAERKMTAFITFPE